MADALSFKSASRYSFTLFIHSILYVLDLYPIWENIDVIFFFFLVINIDVIS